MEYNTAREQMAIPEYGRNVQKMVNYALTIEDRDLRNLLAKIIVDVMASMNPQVKDTNDFEHKLWDHLYIISDFKLDVDSPYPPPQRTDVYSKPKRLPYSEDHIKFKHYGLNLEKLIKKASELEEGDEKAELVRLIANYMKRSYLSWNRDSVSDDMIVAQLHDLSKGELKLREDDKLVATSEVLASTKSKKKKNKSNSGQRKGNNRKQR